MLDMKNRGGKAGAAIKRSVLSRIGTVLVVGFYLFTWSTSGSGQEDIDPTKNYAAFHDSSSRQYKKDCNDCHAAVHAAQSLDPDITDAHVAMFEFAPGKSGDDKQCRWCHQSVDLTHGTQSAATSKGNLRKHVNIAVCTLCHGPEGPAVQFYQAGLSSLVTDGGELYDLVCAACHKDLAKSEVKHKGRDKIYEAIEKDKGGMGPLKALLPHEIQAIADALALVGGGGEEDEKEEDED